DGAARGADAAAVDPHVAARAKPRRKPEARKTRRDPGADALADLGKVRAETISLGDDAPGKHTRTDVDGAAAAHAAGDLESACQARLELVCGGEAVVASEEDRAPMMAVAHRVVGLTRAGQVRAR